MNLLLFLDITIFLCIAHNVYVYGFFSVMYRQGLNGWTPMGALPLEISKEMEA